MNREEAAERALLGALLLDPSQISVVAAWLDAADFTHPRTAIAYQLMTSLAASGRDVDPAGLLDAALSDDAARRNNVAGPYIHDLLASPGGMGRAVIYAQIILEDSVRRRLAEHASDLARRAQVARHDPDGVQTLLESINETYRLVHSLDDRLHTASVEDSPDDLEPVAPTIDTRRSPRPSRAELEAELIQALEDNPETVQRLRPWLLPADFSDPQIAGAYRSMADLARRSLPIDPVTTRWNRRDGYAFVDAEVTHVAGPRARYTTYETIRLGAQVLGESVAENTRAAAETISRLAENPRPAAKQRLQTAMHQLDRRRNDAARLYGSQVEPH